MGWFDRNDKPKEEDSNKDGKPKTDGEIYHTKLPVDGRKLNSYTNADKDKTHPVIPIRNNMDDTTEVIGCTSKYKKNLGDIEITTDPPMPKDTYARIIDGERTIENSKLEPDDDNRKVNKSLFNKLRDSIGQKYDKDN